jgi:hypothetical protein
VQPLLSPVRQLFAAAIVFVCLVLGGIAATALGGGGPVDIRGVYVASPQVGSTAYPQTWHVTRENLSTGGFRGVGTSGSSRFALAGRVTGDSLTVTLTQGSHVAHGVATLTVSGGKVHMTGTYSGRNARKSTSGALFRLSQLRKPKS